MRDASISCSMPAALKVLKKGGLVHYPDDFDLAGQQRHALRTRKI